MTCQSVADAIIVRLQGRADMNRSTAAEQANRGLHGEALVSDSRRHAYLGAIDDVREVVSEFEILQPLSAQVAEFHARFNVPSADKPTVPPDDVVRFRWRLIAEEFFEAMRATFSEENAPGHGSGAHKWLASAEHEVNYAIDRGAIRVNMPELADGLADLDYVVEGSRRAFGIDGAPIARLVHAANMAKVGGGTRDDTKILKPEGWQAPDIIGELRRQGWAG